MENLVPQKTFRQINSSNFFSKTFTICFHEFCQKSQHFPSPIKFVKSTHLLPNCKLHWYLFSRFFFSIDIDNRCHESFLCDIIWKGNSIFPSSVITSVGMEVNTHGVVFPYLPCKNQNLILGHLNYLPNRVGMI